MDGLTYSAKALLESSYFKDDEKYKEEDNWGMTVSSLQKHSHSAAAASSKDGVGFQHVDDILASLDDPHSQVIICSVFV